VHRKAAESFVMKEVEQRGNIVVNSQFDYRNSGSTLELILLGNIIDSSGQLSLQQTLKKEYGLPNCKLILHQGPDSRVAAQKVFKDLSSDMATQNQLIKNLYQRLDSVQQLMHRSHYLDTLRVTLAKEWKKEDSLMQQLSLNQQSFYDPASNKMDTSWTLEVIYPEKSALAKTETDWKEWLKQRLGKEAELKIVRGK
jgi:hypothetical protein